MSFVLSRSFLFTCTWNLQTITYFFIWILSTINWNLPSTSTRIKSCAAAAAYLQYPLKEVQGGEQKWWALCSRKNWQNWSSHRYFQEAIVWAQSHSSSYLCSVSQSHPTLCNPKDYSLPGVSVHSKHGYWSGLPFSPPGDLPDPRIKPTSPVSPALVGRFLTTEPPGKPHLLICRQAPKSFMVTPEPHY